MPTVSEWEQGLDEWLEPFLDVLGQRLGAGGLRSTFGACSGAVSARACSRWPRS